MEELLRIVLIILVSSVKFVAGPTFAYLDRDYGFTFFETVSYCVAGGMLGVWFFTFTNHINTFNNSAQFFWVYCNDFTLLTSGFSRNYFNGIAFF